MRTLLHSLVSLRIDAFSFVQLHEGQTLEHHARIVSLDANNRVTTAG
jgi:hypothetical protein